MSLVKLFNPATNSKEYDCCRYCFKHRSLISTLSFIRPLILPSFLVCSECLVHLYTVAPIYGGRMRYSSGEHYFEIITEPILYTVPMLDI